MSITFQRHQIEQKINSMDSGPFQEFMLKFLPVYHEKYEGMIRNGGTSEGKTRKGIPDLIKTYENGDQIGCECGTEANYWKMKEDITKLKPIGDAKKCLKELKKPVEIILASNREFPPTNANIKSDIKNYLSENNPNCEFTILSSACISEWLVNHLQRGDVLNFAQHFLYEAVENAILKKNNEAHKWANEALYEAGFININSLLETLNIAECSKVQIKIQMTSMIVGDNSRFIEQLPHEFNGVKRIQTSCPELCSPLGKINLLIGIPKIGKHYLVWEMVDSTQFNYKRFVTPLGVNILDDFVENLLISIYSIFIREDKAIAKVINQQPIDNKNDKVDILFANISLNLILQKKIAILKRYFFLLNLELGKIEVDGKQL